MIPVPETAQHLLLFGVVCALAAWVIFFIFNFFRSPWALWNVEHEKVLRFEEAMRPQLHLSFDPREKDCADKVPIGQTVCIYYRMRVEALKEKTVNGCRGFISAIYREDEQGSPIKQSLRDALHLRWGTLEFDPIAILHRPTSHLDLFWIDAKDGVIHPVARHGSNATDILTTTGTYYLDILVNNEDGIAATKRIKVRMGNCWDEAIVESV